MIGTKVYYEQNAHVEATMFKLEHATIVGKSFPQKIAKMYRIDCSRWNHMLKHKTYQKGKKGPK